MSLETVEAILREFGEKFVPKVNKMQAQIDALDERVQHRPGFFAHGGGSASGGGGAKALLDAFQSSREVFEKSGRLRFEVPDLLRKATPILSTDRFAPQAAAGVDPAGRFPYQLRAALPMLPCLTGSVFALRESTTTGGASEQSPEGSAKSELVVSLEGRTLEISTIAHFLKVSRQALDDIPGLQSFLDATLIHGLEKKIEQLLLHSNGVGSSMLGLIHAGSPLDTAILGASAWDRATLIAAALSQLRAGGFSPSHVILHPNDWMKVETTRTEEGAYVVGSPKSVLPPALWGAAVLLSPEIDEGLFAAADFSRVLLRERLGVVVDVSESDSDDFQKNLICFRCEWRGALIVQQSGAVIFGSLTTSPE